jgi:microsomal dipeptidase-like Zn-dependent dipeptidase
MTCHPSIMVPPFRATNSYLSPACCAPTASGGGDRNHWAWRLLLPALLFAFLLCAPAPSFAAACGGDGQRACCNGDVEFSNNGTACNSGAVYVDKCTDPAGCGCSGGFITAVDSIGMCYVPKACGGAGQRACCNGDGEFSNNGLACNSGLIQLSGACGPGGGAACVCGGGLFYSAGTCVTPTSSCGGKGQRACCAGTLEYSKVGTACDSGLIAVAGCAGDCTCGGTTSLGQVATTSCTVIETIVEPTTNATPTANEPDSTTASTPTTWTLPQEPLPSGPLCPPTGLCGYADMHVHMFANLAHGGATLAGEPWDAKGVNTALGEDYGLSASLQNANGLTGDVVDKDGNTKKYVDNGLAPTCPDILQSSPLGNLCSGQRLFHGDHTLIDTTTGGGTNDGAASNLGVPLFNGWPQWTSTVHQQVYYKWLERAWLGGLRLMVMDAVTNEALCKSSSHMSGVTCSLSMPEIDLQLQAAKSFQTWLDAQYGGTGKGWFQIVTDPAQAERAIQQGKLAVILGIEVDNLFNCHLQNANGASANSEGPACTTDYVQQQLQNYYNLGVRHLFPIHNFDNAYGTPAAWQDAINVGNFASEGGFWDAVNCTAPGYGFSLDPTIEEAELLLGFKQDYKPDYPSPPWASCHNTPGLTPLGRFLIQQAMKMGMIIDVDHMSINAFNDTLGMAQGARYAGIAASHVQFFDLYTQNYAGTSNGGRHERMRTKDQLKAIAGVGGMIAVMLKDDVQDTANGWCPPGNTCAPAPLGPGPVGGQFTVDYNGPNSNYGLKNNCMYSTTEWAQAYLYGADNMGGPVAMGSDFNGIAGHVGPRFGSGACGGNGGQRTQQEAANNRLVYPFTLPGFGSFDKQVSGQRVFDFNTDGLAHIGLLPDMVADLRNAGLNDAQLQPLFGSAQAYVDMWSKVQTIAFMFTSAATVTFTVGASGSFLVTSQASPAATYTETGALPAGVVFTPSGSLSGTPTTTDGTYPITFTASNGVLPNATQQFTLVVNLNSTGITSPDTATFQAGSPGSFAITATIPLAPASIITSGQLPKGLTFNGNTNVISGTPAYGSGGVYILEFQVYPTSGGFRTGKLTLTVNEGPSFLSANRVTPPLIFNTGTAASFQLNAPGYPAPALSLLAHLPPGLEFSPANGGVIAGTVPPGRGGVYSLQLNAKNEFGFAGEPLTIVVNDAPVITSVATTTFTIGKDNIFLITATGYPTPKFSWSGLSSSLPGVMLDSAGKLEAQLVSDNGLGKYTFVVTADTGIAKTTQNFTLYIKDSPKITWSPGSLPFGSGLGAAQLNASAVLQSIGTIPGMFVYSPPAGTFLPPGTQLLSVTFTPGDTTKYFGVTAEVQVNATLPVNGLQAVPVGNTISSARNGTLTVTQVLTSPSGRFIAIMQADGNFVVYNQNNPVWASNTNGQGSAPFNLIIQSDGNLVVNANTPNCQANTACTPTWASNTAGHGTGPYNLVMQDDGNLVIYDSTNTATWATGTNQFTNVITSQSATLMMGQALTSPSGVFRAVMQTDGNFVVYQGPRVLWATGTTGVASNVSSQGGAPYEMIVTPDGDLERLAYLQTCPANTPCLANWFSYTKGKGTPPYMLTMQDDGNLVLYDSTNKPIWVTGTNQFQNIMTSESAPLMMGQALTSPNRIYQAFMQTDGNFVVYHGTAALWATGTTGATSNGLPNGSPYEMVVTPDGDLEHLAYAPTCLINTPCIANWSSNTKGKGTPPYMLTMQDDGNLVLYDSTNTPTWASGTSGR